MNGSLILSSADVDKLTSTVCVKVLPPCDLFSLHINDVTLDLWCIKSQLHALRLTAFHESLVALYWNRYGNPYASSVNVVYSISWQRSFRLTLWRVKNKQLIKYSVLNCAHCGFKVYVLRFHALRRANLNCEVFFIFYLQNTDMLLWIRRSWWCCQRNAYVGLQLLCRMWAVCDVSSIHVASSSAPLARPTSVGWYAGLQTFWRLVATPACNVRSIHAASVTIISENDLHIRRYCDNFPHSLQCRSSTVE